MRERFFPNILLTTHEGRKVRFYDDCVRGKTVTINFTFLTCAGLCPDSTDNLLKLQAKLGGHLGRDVFMYSITLKPQEDTLEKLRRHVKEKGCKRGWTFLTGDLAEITQLRRKLGIVAHDPVDDPDPMQHTRMIRYGNEPLMLWSAAWNASNPETLARSILELTTVGKKRP
jgi:protein SCO1/2